LKPSNQFFTLVATYLSARLSVAINLVALRVHPKDLFLEVDNSELYKYMQIKYLLAGSTLAILGTGVFPVHFSK